MESEEICLLDMISSHLAIPVVVGFGVAVVVTGIFLKQPETSRVKR